MKKIIVAMVLVFSLVAGQSMAFARSWNGWGQDGDIFIAIWENEFKEIAQKPMCIAQDVPEKGGPMLDDEHVLLVPIDISMTFGYETTEGDDNITVKHDKRTIVIHKNENKAEIDKKTIDLFHKQANGTTYLPYKSLDELFDVDLDWDAGNKYLLITERETTPVSEEQKALRKRMSTPSTPAPTKEPSSAVAYTDCDSKVVTELTEMEILSGDGDGKFRPNDTLTRAEFATMAAMASGIEYMNIESWGEDSGFPDVANDFWGIEYIRFAVAKGIINGFEDGTFKSDDNVSYAQAVKMCLSTAGYNNIVEEAKDGKWYETWLEAANTYGLTTKKESNPDRVITRLEAAELIYNTIDLPLVLMSGMDMSGDEPVPHYSIYDGKSEVNGEVTELETLRTRYFDWYKN